MGRDAAIALAASLVLVLVLELALRVFAPQTLEGRSIRGEHFQASDPVLGMRYLPGAVWRFTHPEYSVEYAINAEGFRDRTPHPTPKPVATSRMLLLGDSFTFGQAVDYDQTWPVLVERELDRRGFQVDLVKAGVQGADTRSELILMRQLVQRYDPDVIVVGFLINDLYTNLPYTPGDEDAGEGTGELDARVASAFQEKGEDRTFHLLTLARRVVTSFDAGYIGLYLAAPQRGDYLRTPLPPEALRQLRITETLFRQMVQYCDSLGKSLVVLSIPQQFQVLYARSSRQDTGVDVSYYDRHFSSLARESGFGWVSTLDAFTAAAEHSREELFYRLDGHLTAAGNAVVAEAFLKSVVPGTLAQASNPAP